jgi:IS5 family transposase
MDSLKFPTQREIFLAEMECTVPWHKLRALVEPMYATPFRRRPHPIELNRLLRIFFLQRWFRLTDAAVRESICDSNAMRSFVCLSAEAVPNEEEIGRFGRMLEEYGLTETLVLAAERHLRALGIAVAPGSIVDAARISASNAYAQAPYARIIDTAGVAG